MCTTNILKENGLRVTQQRILIYDVLNKYRIHPTVDMLYSIVAEIDSSIGIATVYKTIDAFKTHNIVKEIKCENTPSRYDINTSCHSHFECVECGKFEDFPYANVDSFVQQNDNFNNYKLHGATVIFSGVCPECS